MFGCIYFEEDCSLSVVGKRDRDLNVDGNFEEKTKVQMVWKINQERKTFNGTIIKVHEEEKYLNEFALQANKKVVKPNAASGHGVIIQKLLDYNLSDEKSASVPEGKRPRKATTLIKESKQQDEELSPKKKKRTAQTQDQSKIEQDKKKTCNINKNNAKKKLEAATTLNSKEINNEIIKYCNLSSQFEDQDDHIGDTNLSSIGKTLLESSNIVNEIEIGDDQNSMHTMYSKVPLPPPEVISFFKALYKPDVRNFIKQFVEHFDNACSSHINHQCYEPSYSAHLSNQANFQPFTASHTVVPDHAPVQTQTSTFQHSQSTCSNLSVSNLASADQPSSSHQPLSCIGSNAYSSSNQSQDTCPEDLPPLVRRTSPRKTSHTSPRKTSQTSPRKTSTVHSSMNKEVRIVEGFPYQIPSDQLWKVTSKAKKDKRPGYAMVLKLMPLIFATEEMANSRGQGLKPAKDGDLKPVLDAEKMKAIKTYAEGFDTLNRC